MKNYIRRTNLGLAALFALSIAAGGFLSLYRLAFFGPVTRPAVAQAEDLRPREWLVLVLLIAMIVGIGIYPGPWIEAVRPAAEAWGWSLSCAALRRWWPDLRNGLRPALQRHGGS